MEHVGTIKTRAFANKLARLVTSGKSVEYILGFFWGVSNQPFFDLGAFGNGVVE